MPVPKGRQDCAGELLDRAIGLAQEAGDVQLLRLLLGSSAEMNIWLGHYEVAEKAYGDALSLAAEIGDFSARPLLLAELGWMAILRGDPLTAQRLSVEAAELAEDLGRPECSPMRSVWAVRPRCVWETWLDASEALDRALTVTESLNAPAEVAGVRCSRRAWHSSSRIGNRPESTPERRSRLRDWPTRCGGPRRNGCWGWSTCSKVT